MVREDDGPVCLCERFKGAGLGVGCGKRVQEDLKKSMGLRSQTDRKKLRWQLVEKP